MVWDFEAFIRYYNAYGRDRGGIVFDPRVVSAEKLEERYSAGLWGSLRRFAEAVYIHDNMM